MNIIESEFEDCYPERIIAADLKAEYDRIWDVLKKEAAERLITQNPNLVSGEPVRITLPEVINQYWMKWNRDSSDSNRASVTFFGRCQSIHTMTKASLLEQ